MKMKLTTLLFGLLLAVGWTSNASAQMKTNGSIKLQGLTEFSLKDRIDDAGSHNVKLKAPNRAPNRGEGITADATHVYSWYDAITYDWVDANGGSHQNKITEVATNPYQIAYLLGTTYMNPEIPGLKYTAVTAQEHPYPNIEFGWDIPNNARWNYNGNTGLVYGGITIIPDATNQRYISYTEILSISVVSGNTTISSWSYGENGGSFPSGWSLIGSSWALTNDGYLYANTQTRDHAISITGSILTDYENVKVVIVARDYNYNTTGYRRIIVNEETQNLTSGYDGTYTWNIAGSEKMLVTKPIENGYTIFLVKVKDGVGAAPAFTYNWNSGDDNLINYFDTYIEEVQLLTDGTRLNEGTEDAGTMFSYSGELNRFYFIGKGNDYIFGSSESDLNPHLAPTYDMYEEFSPTTTETGDETTDFYSKLLYGNSYNVIHDCRGMNYFQHYFSMSGNNGTDHKSMTNLIFWIPDNRGVYGERDYNEEFLPHVGLYNIILEAEAQPAADYSVDNRMYDVTCDWVSTLNTILDFEVDQQYELWIYIYDENGNPVADQKVGDILENTTTLTYQVPQKPESYTIVYRVKGWPKDATNSPGQDPNGTFFALSNLDPVLIPGYNNFLSLSVDHYESDFAIAEEHNYYRNFLTVDNQNPDNALTAKRIVEGDSAYVLNRFDVALPNQLTEAADLVFAKDGNDITYKIKYANQQYIDDANQAGMSQTLTGYKNLNALGCPTSGVIATISEGGGTIEPPVNYYEKVTSTDDLTDGEYLIVCENNNVALDGSLTDFYNTTTGFTNTISVAPSDNKIESNATTDAATFTITRSGNGYTIRSKSGYYIGNASATNTQIMESQSTQYPNSISISNGNASILYTHTTSGWWSTTYDYYLKYGSASNMQRFAYTTSTSNYQNIQLYKFVNNSTDGLLNGFLDNSTYTQPGIVVFELPWKSINVKLQDESAGTSAGYFMIQSGGRLRFVMPAGFNNASLRFVIHNAPVESNYYDGTFTLTSSTGSTQTITIPSGSSLYGDQDYEAIFTGISSGDVITITGTHTVVNNDNTSTLYNYSPDFKYIHVYVEGGHDGIGMTEALNLAAVKFVDQFNAETKEDKHPKGYGYVLKPKVGDLESGKPDVPVLHAGSVAGGFYSLAEIQGDTKAELTMNVMNSDITMTLSRDPDIYYYTLDRQPNSATTWEELSKLQKRGDDSYQEMYDKLDQYDDQICNPPTDATATWTVERYDDNIMTGEYNDYMSYVPIIWSHGELSTNRRVKWNTEQRHNSYGSPIWKTGVADVVLETATAERQKTASTNWTYEGKECSLYMLDGIKAVATMPTVNNVSYVPYMFRIFVKSKNNKLRGYTQVAQGEGQYDGEHYEGAPIDDPSLQCVWSTYLNETAEALVSKGVTIGITEANGVKTITFTKKKMDRTGGSDANPMGDWDQEDEVNAIFAGLKDIITEANGSMTIDPDDLTIFVRFYYILEGMMPTTNTLRAGDGNPGAGYGAEGSKAPNPATSVDEILYHGEIVSQTYINTQGMQSDKPFDGVNIVVTRYSDGATSVSKVVR
jgi:hypothetical protein